MWKIVFSKQAVKDSKIVLKSHYEGKVRELLSTIEKDPFCTPPVYEKLQPPQDDAYSRRINKQHRLVYRVYKKTKIIKIMSLWTHYQ